MQSANQELALGVEGAELIVEALLLARRDERFRGGTFGPNPLLLFFGRGSLCFLSLSSSLQSLGEQTAVTRLHAPTRVKRHGEREPGREHQPERHGGAEVRQRQHVNHSY